MLLSVGLYGRSNLLASLFSPEPSMEGARFYTDVFETRRRPSKIYQYHSHGNLLIIL